MNEPDLPALVSPIQGTDSNRVFSKGNTLPLCQWPWGMTAWTPQTHEGRWLFQYRHPKLQGFRATRQPSPWIGDYAPLTLWPQQGPRVLDPDRRASACRYDRSLWQPHRQRHHLLRDRITVDLAPTERSAMLAFSFEEKGPCRLILDLAPGKGGFDWERERGELTVWTRANSGGAHETYTGFYVLSFSEPVVEVGFVDRAGKTSEPFLGASTFQGDHPQAFLEFAEPLSHVRIGSSFISFDQARTNLDTEIGNRSLEETAALGHRRWSDLLGRIALTDADESLARTFYTCLYRALCFPRRMEETGAAGATVHRSPYDGAVHPGPLSADNGFWDTHRTVYGLYSLAYRAELGDLLAGWLAAYRESGWLPTWSSPGHRACMIGTHIDAVFADAIAKDIPGFDRDLAFEAILKNATVPPPSPAVGRADLADYLALGYLPHGKGVHSVSATLDHAYNDWCIGQVARRLGRIREAEDMTKRGDRWRDVFDPALGFARPKHPDGTWVEPFDPFTWGGPFVEGSAWQCSLAVPHDPAGVIAAMGGPEALVKRLDFMLASPPKYRIGHYPDEIHEMTEMAMADFGLYAHSNQPSHGLLWWYTMAGRPDRTQFWVRRILLEAYGTGPGGLPGDEDNGEMGAWYVLSAMGLYPFCMGDPGWVVSAPLFPDIHVGGGDGKFFRIRAPGAGPDRPYVRSLALAGKAHPGLRVDHRRLMSEGLLEFELGDAPSSAPVAKEHLPFPVGA